MARPFLALLALACAARAGAAVPREGPPVFGPVVVAAGSVHAGGETRPLDDFLLVEDDAGAVLHAAGLEERIEAYRRIVRAQRLPRLLGLADDAYRARDIESSVRILDWAREHGIDEREERRLRLRVERLEKLARPVDEPASAKVRARLAVLRAMEPDLFLARARSEPDRAASLRLLREALRADPDHETSRARLAEIAPDGQPFDDALGWLAWEIEMRPEGFEIVREGRIELDRARHYWRPDLTAFACDEILLITPARDHAFVRACLSRGRATVRALADGLRTDDPRKRPEGPLLAHVHVSPRLFSEAAGYERPSPWPPWHRFRHGTFDEREDLCRFLAPASEDERDAFAFAFAHELARHWLWSRNPRTSAAEIMANRDDCAGYWVEVGFCAMAAEGGEWASRDAPSARLVAERAGRSSRGLLPWRDVFLANVEAVAKLSYEDPELERPARDRRDLPRAEVYRAQAATICRYLWGARRDALLDYLTDRMVGRTERLDPASAFGLTPDGLGARAVAFARGQ